MKLKRSKQKTTETAENTAVTGSVSGARIWSGRAKPIIIVLLALIFIAAGILLYRTLTKKDNQTTATPACSGETLTNLTNNFVPTEPEKIDALGPIIEEVKQLENYDQDINCLYPITWYYIFTGNKYEADNYFAKLEPIFSVEGLSVDFRYIATIESAKAKIDNLARLEEEAKTNASGFNPPEGLE